MRIRHLKPSVAETDMTPMIDMTFQLIAFFMIVSNFEQMQADERVKLPADELAMPPEFPREDDIVVNVGYTKDSDEPFLFYGDHTTPVLQSAEYFQRERRLQEVLVPGPDSLSKVTIVIRADQSVPTGLIQEMMRIAQEVGFTRFSLKARQGQEEVLE